MSDNKDGRFSEDKYYLRSARNALSTIRVKYEEVNSAFTYLTNRLQELNNCQQDLMHYMEFADLDIQKGYKAYKKLQEVRIERRLVKNELESMEVAYETLKKIKDSVRDIQQAQSKCGKIEKRHSKRTYAQRAKRVLDLDDFDKQMERYNEKLESMVIIK